MSTTFTASVELTTIECGKCGGTYAINERYRKEKYECSGSWNCPYCEISWGYQGSENQRLKEKVAKLQTDIEHKEADSVQVPSGDSRRSHPNVQSCEEWGVPVLQSDVSKPPAAHGDEASGLQGDRMKAFRTLLLLSSMMGICAARDDVHTHPLWALFTVCTVAYMLYVREIIK